MKKLLLILCLMASPIQTDAKHIYPEKVYQEQWCKAHQGTIEYRLKDNSRIDCLTEEYAIEFDFANKWAEAIGQSLYYGLMTCKKPGIVLIIENENKDIKHLKRLQEVAKSNNITIWITTNKELY